VPALILVINPTIQYTVFDRLKIYLEGTGANRRFCFSFIHFISNFFIHSFIHSFIDSFFFSFFKKKKTRQLGGFEIFLLGAIGKVAATVVTYPYILAKSRLQVARGSDTEKKPNGILEVSLFQLFISLLFIIYYYCYLFIHSFIYYNLFYYPFFVKQKNRFSGKF